MAGLESFNMDYHRQRPSKSTSEHSMLPQSDHSDAEIVRQQQRETLIEMSRKKSNCQNYITKTYIIIVNYFK